MYFILVFSKSICRYSAHYIYLLLIYFLALLSFLVGDADIDLLSGDGEAFFGILTGDLVGDLADVLIGDL